MNDACPSAARLTEFAQTPLQEENVDIAVHILQCRDCAKKLYLMNQIILSHCEVTQDEWAEIKSFRPHRNSPANNLWQKVEHFLNSVFPTDFEFIHVMRNSRKSRHLERNHRMSTAQSPVKTAKRLNMSIWSSRRIAMTKIFISGLLLCKLICLQETTICS